MKTSNYHTSSVKLSTVNRGHNGNEDVTKFIKEINDERMKKSRVEFERKVAEDRLKEANLKINQLENQNRRLESQTTELNGELRRVAWRLGGDIARDNRVFTGEELRMLDVSPKIKNF
jgi:chromosome segregation ATPase